MNLGRKHIFYSALGLIAFWIVLGIISCFFPFEFKNRSIPEIHAAIRIFIFPIAVLVTLAGTMDDNDPGVESAVKLISTLFLSGISFFVLLFALLVTSMCETTEKTIFINATDPSITIVEQSTGCGATDGDSPRVSIAKIKTVMLFFKEETEIDTSKINHAEWIFVGEHTDNVD